MRPSYTIVLPGVPVSSPRGATGWLSVVLLELGAKKFLFDTGSYGDRGTLLEKLRARGIAPRDIDTVFLSHCHFDHSVNAEVFEDAELYMSRTEFEYAFDEQYLRSRDPYVPMTILNKLKPRFTLIEDGHEFAEGVRAVALPGHTPGMMGLYLESDRVLLASDSVKNAWEFIRNQAPPSFFEEAASLRSYDRARSLADIIVPGHDRSFRIAGTDSVEYLPTEPVDLNYVGDPYTDPKPIKLL